MSFKFIYSSEFSKQLRLKNLHLLNHCSSSAKDQRFNRKHVFQVLQQCKKPANQLKFKLELIYPIVDDPEARLPKLKNQIREVQGKFGNEFDQDTIKTCVRKHQDAQRYARQSARATTFFKYMNGKCDLNILEKRIEGFFQRQKWTTPEDVKQDIRKVFLLVLPMLQNPDSRRMGSDGSAKIMYKWMAHNMDFECQTVLFERCDTQSWPGVCPANFKSYGRGLVSTQKFFKNEIVLDYHGQILEKMTLTQALAMEGVQPEYLMEVRNLKFFVRYIPSE